MSALLLSSTHSLWTDICTVDDILPGTGVCALVAGQHVAVFRTSDDQFFAIDNVDPKSGASVLSRGLIGNLGGAHCGCLAAVQEPLRPAHGGVPRVA